MSLILNKASFQLWLDRHYVAFRYRRWRNREAEERLSDEAEQPYKFIGSKKLDELRRFIPRYFSFSSTRSKKNFMTL